jgi:hypothetical protein
LQGSHVLHTWSTLGVGFDTAHALWISRRRRRARQAAFNGINALRDAVDHRLAYSCDIWRCAARLHGTMNMNMYVSAADAVPVQPAIIQSRRTLKCLNATSNRLRKNDLPLVIEQPTTIS